MRARGLVATVAVVLGACNGLLGIEERGLRPDSGSEGLDGGFDAPLPDASGSDAPSEAQPQDGGPDGYDAGPCQTGRGPAMVVTPGACVDSTEVTRLQYKAFLDTNPKTTGQDPRCAWNDSFVPTGGWPPDNTSNELPVTWVDFCDAVAFCKWAGKHLCGLRDGGAPLPVTSMNPSAEWYYGCTHAAITRTRTAPRTRRARATGPTEARSRRSGASRSARAATRASSTWRGTPKNGSTAAERRTPRATISASSGVDRSRSPRAATRFTPPTGPTPSRTSAFDAVLAREGILPII